MATTSEGLDDAALAATLGLANCVLNVRGVEWTSVERQLARALRAARQRIAELQREARHFRSVDGPVWSVVVADTTAAEQAKLDAEQPHVSSPEWDAWRRGFESATRFYNARIRRATATPAAREGDGE